jgi:hypothetical protein
MIRRNAKRGKYQGNTGKEKRKTMVETEDPEHDDHD